MYSTDVGVSIGLKMSEIAYERVQELIERKIEEAAMLVAFLEAVGIKVDIDDVIDWDEIFEESEEIIEDCGQQGEDDTTTQIEEHFFDYPQEYIDTAVDDGVDNFWSTYDVPIM